MSPRESIVFIVTKPLQIMMAMVIRDSFKSGTSCHLYIVNDFFNVTEVSQRLTNHDLQWRSVTNFPTRQAAIDHLQYRSVDNVFIDSDVGIRLYLSLRAAKRRSKGLKISVYEEGCGTYQDDYYPPLKAGFLRLLGVGDRLGGCHLTDEIWLYEKNEYLDIFPATKTLVREIRQPLHDFLKANMGLLKKIFVGNDEVIPSGSESNGDACIIYLSSWRVYEEVVSDLQQEKKDLYIKLHPHIKNYDSRWISGHCRMLPSAVPAEIAIMDLAKHYLDILVYHHDSSVARYVSLENLRFVNLGDSDPLP
ncbi:MULTISPECIES: hypothetical protein [unclassified Modicisalibacter]|uniref:polysialyltransferase family glycosyltransferase n=1 Tax=unclassified Modicisalibacter TaxID=2679913 RepID=UPI001CC90714|nr:MULTISPECIES: hypothetical protein [unclassified Modicisalibacter]MBZ9560012.1 hypothetical protein [Modicisalibacter sp. R2A 31.J]MBZ9575921.1 hypothetical protein [Modicisalibacter sp. MOD 31.J]